MAAIIASNITSFDYEPDIITDNGRDGITAFQFSIVGSFSYLSSNFALDQVVSGVPDQPQGNFRVVRRNISHIAGDAQTGLYRLQVSAEGGTGDSSLYILESSYQYQKETATGQYFNEIFGGSTPLQYNLEWLSPTVTITTNSQSEDIVDVQNRAKAIVTTLSVQVIKNKPVTAPNGKNVIGVNIDESKIIITGSSVEKAGGLYRVRVSATKGQVQDPLDVK
jgi:hypothetical protein